MAIHGQKTFKEVTYTRYTHNFRKSTLPLRGVLFLRDSVGCVSSFKRHLRLGILWCNSSTCQPGYPVVLHQNWVSHTLRVAEELIPILAVGGTKTHPGDITWKYCFIHEASQGSFERRRIILIHFYICSNIEVVSYLLVNQREGFSHYSCGVTGLSFVTAGQKKTWALTS